MDDIENDIPYVERRETVGHLLIRVSRQNGSMEIKHDKNGVHYPYHGKYLTIMGAGVCNILSDDQIVACAHATIRLNQQLGRLSSREVCADEFRIGDTLEEDDISVSSPFIKYIAKADYEQYYSKGLFVKPESFTPEDELRITFEMDNDLEEPLFIDCPELLEFIEFDT